MRTLISLLIFAGGVGAATPSALSAAITLRELNTPGVAAKLCLESRQPVIQSYRTGATIQLICPTPRSGKIPEVLVIF